MSNEKVHVTIDLTGKVVLVTPKFNVYMDPDDAIRLSKGLKDAAEFFKKELAKKRS